MSLEKLQQIVKAPKNQYNNFGKYKYRSCEDILQGAKAALAEVGGIITLSDETIQLGERYYIKATATYTKDGESISVSAFAREPISKKGMDESQVTGAASSYARKYALNGLLAIDDTKDSDTQKPESKTERAERYKKEADSFWNAEVSPVCVEMSVDEHVYRTRLEDAYPVSKFEDVNHFIIENKSGIIARLRNNARWCNGEDVQTVPE